jgi:hypothetical protein
VIWILAGGKTSPKGYDKVISHAGSRALKWYKKFLFNSPQALEFARFHTLDLIPAFCRNTERRFTFQRGDFAKLGCEDAIILGPIKRSTGDSWETDISGASGREI